MLELFDVRILSFISSIISLILCLCMLYILRTRKAYNGFIQWTVASIFYFLALALLSMRGKVPDFFSVVLANTLIITGNGYIVSGLELFMNISKKIWITILGSIFTIICFIYYTYFNPDINMRIIIISALIAIYYYYSAYLVYKYVPMVIMKHNKLLTIAFTVQASWLILRIIHTIYSRVSIVDFMNTSVFQGLTVLIFFCGNILIVIGLIVLNFQRVEFDCGVAMAEVKTLRGLIPICSSCKQIRDDKGIWNQIEIYLRNHSDAEFSHSICPKCLKDLYPDFDINNRNHI